MADQVLADPLDDGYLEPAGYVEESYSPVNEDYARLISMIRYLGQRGELV